MLTLHRLLFLQIKWPADDKWKTNFIISVDGVHCRYHEEIDPVLSKKPKLFSHKYNGPALFYELALSLFTSDLVHMKGPEQKDDRGIYRSELQAKIPEGKKAIADGGYRDKKDPKISTPNVHDPPELRKFKGRAKARQETFNSRIKRFDCLKNDFRHKRERHKVCFEAICVICQYEMELGSPLFDV